MLTFSYPTHHGRHCDRSRLIELCSAVEEPVNTTMIPKTEKALLERAALVIGSKFLMYVPEKYPHTGGLLYLNSGGRQQVWNPRINDGNLLQLAVAAPAVNLLDILSRAAEISENGASRRT